MKNRNSYVFNICTKVRKIDFMNTCKTLVKKAKNNSHKMIITMNHL